MKWIDYRERLGIGFSDQEKFVMLKNKASILLNEFRGNYTYSKDDYCAYQLMVGESDCYSDSDPALGLRESVIYHTNSTADFLSKYIAFYNTYHEEHVSQDYPTKVFPKQLILGFIKQSLDDLKIQYSVFQDDDGIFIFPKGISEFDDSLVSSPLQWLSAYPNAEKAWSKALREYSENVSRNASDVADLFRKTLETFFQEFFKSDKTLENLKSRYGDYLKCNGIPKEISANLESLLQAYTNYINSYAKHRDATSDKVLEYLMYQTGNIIRLLITLNQEAEPHAD